MSFFPGGGLFKQGDFQIDPNSTPEMIARKREMLAAMMPRYGEAKYVGQGVGQLAMGIAQGRKNRALDKFEGERSAEAAGLFNRVFSGNQGNGGGGPLNVLGMRPEPPNPNDAKFPVGQEGPAPQGNIDPASGLNMGTPVASIPDPVKNGIFAGESGGDYNALFGFSNRDGKRYSGVKLTDMTVDQALDFANPSGDYGQWVKGQVGRVATPMGAYQIVGSTLRDAKKALGLTGNERMTQDLQDRLGAWIYKTQGTGAWEGYKGPQDSFQPGPGTRVAQNGLQMNDLMMAAQNPWLTPQQRSVINTQIQQMQSQQSRQQDRAWRREDAQWEQQQAQQDPMYQLRLRQAQLDYEQDQSGSSGNTEYGLNPQYGVDEQGNPVIIQLGKDGSAVQTPLPEGVTFQKEPIKVDGGTHWILLDPISRQPVGQVPKNLAEAEAEKVRGKAEGEAIASADSDYTAGQNALDLLDSIRNDPARGIGTGKSSIIGMVPGTQAYDFQRKVEQAKSGAFMTAIQQMRGMGALSNAEGQTATAAVTRMNTAMTDKGFLDALNDYEKIIRQGMAKAQRRGARPAAERQATPASDVPEGVDPKLWEYMPEEDKALFR